MTIAEEFYASLQPASFGGFVFDVDDFQSPVGNLTATQTAVGYGQRVKVIAPRLRPISFRAYLSTLNDERQPRDVVNDKQQFEALLNSPIPRTLIHPWHGALEGYVCTEGSGQVVARDVRYISYDLSFAPTEFPPLVPTPPDIPQNGADARAEMVQKSAEFATESTAVTELFTVAEALGIEDQATDAQTAQVTTARLLDDANIAASGVPGSIQAIGSATRSADAGEYTASARDRLFSEVMNVAMSRNSPTLLGVLQSLKLLLSERGGGALAQSVTTQSGTLQSLAVNYGLDTRVLASRNRSAVRDWYPRGTVQL